MNYLGHEYQKEKVEPIVPDISKDDDDKDDDEDDDEEEEDNNID